MPERVVRPAHERLQTPVEDVDPGAGGAGQAATEAGPAGPAAAGRHLSVVIETGAGAAAEDLQSPVEVSAHGEIAGEHSAQGGPCGPGGAALCLRSVPHGVVGPDRGNLQATVRILVLHR